jgi:hypothetical protein
MDVPETTSSRTIVEPYPTSKRQRSISVVPATKKLPRVLRSLQSHHAAYITHLQPETKDKTYQREFAMNQAVLNSVAFFKDGSARTQQDGGHQ